NENNNGLLRRDGLTKDRDLRNLPDELVNQLMSKRNRIPRKSLDYRTPYEVLMEHITLTFQALKLIKDSTSGSTS
ncbi:hypothetical protein ACLOA0_10045, partial [Limosilactobacillus fermentum]